MSILTSTWHELVRRRLLPVAILLLAALVAVPLLLAKESERPAPVPAAKAPAASGAEAIDESIVTLVEEGEQTRRRRVLGARKNPFEPAPVKAAKAPEPVTGTSPSPSSGTAAGGAGAPKIDAPAATGGGALSGGGAPSSGPVASDPGTPPAGTAPAPRKRHELYSLAVRFGSSDGGLERRTLPRLKALPNPEEAFLVYLGVTADKKRAVFMVDANVRPQGDGVCRPDPVACETIELAEGETEFFDVYAENEDGTLSEEPAAQYQLDVLKIRRTTSAGTAKAAAARAKQAAAGRKLLRAHEAAVGPLRYRYDVKSGTVRKLAPKAYEAAVARVTRAALASAGAFDIER